MRRIAFFFLHGAAALFISTLTLTDVPAASAGPAPQDKEEVKENIFYKWAFVARMGTGEGRHVLPITRDTTLRSGEEVKLFVHLLRKCYVYVVHRSPGGEIRLLFPYSMESENELEKNYYVPKGRGWFVLDKNTGPETYYILASAERLTGLENSLRSYAATSGDEAKKTAASVVNEIKEVKKRYRTFATLAERPISIAGNVRGTRSLTDVDRIDIATLATEVSAHNFYSKTITIDHK